MEGSGGCCIARYAGGAYDKSKVDRIMLRFRPIAPKPAVAGAASGNSVPENGSDGVFKGGRTKRRYVMKENSNKRCNRKRKLSCEQKDGSDDATSTGTGVATLLPLLPEMPDMKATVTPASAPASSDLDLMKTVIKPAVSGPIWLSFNPGAVVIPKTVSQVGSLVTVERVTEGSEGGEGLGYTDGERRKNLERDSCPGFISDGVNRVEWTNEAYRKMIIGEEEEREGWSDQTTVWLVTKERLPLCFETFTCQVRVQYACRKEKHSMTVPCDVWRMDGGGFAWRLDVKAALSLGR